MKKIFIFILITILCFLGLVKMGDYFLKLRIENKEDIVYKNWSNLNIMNQKNILLIKKLNNEQIYLNNDSLDKIIAHHKELKECSLDYVEYEFYINKGMLNILSDSLVSKEDKNTLKTNIQELNDFIEIYNLNARDYNTFIRGFPINLYTYKKYKTKPYFDLEYGVINKNPKEKYKQIPTWMLEVEKSKGL